MRIIYGRAGSGKSEYIYNDIIKRINNENSEKIYIITPEQFSFNAEKRLLDKINENATTSVEVLSFERMAYRVIQETMPNNKIKLDNSSKAMIIYDAINKKQKDLCFLGKNTQNIQTIITQITEFKKHDISVEKLREQVEKTEDKYLKSKLNDMLIMYDEFENQINSDFIDENDLLTILSDNLEKSNLFNNAVFYLDEFSGFTKQEYKVIAKLNKIAKMLYITICSDSLRITKSPDSDIFYDNKNTIQTLNEIEEIDVEKQIHLQDNYRFKNDELKHLEKNIFDIPYKIYEKENKNIKLFLAENQYEEVKHIAKQIYLLIRDEGYRYKDIAIICNDIATYSSLINAIFKEYDIPVFIDEKKDLNKNILIRYFTSIMDIFAKNFSYEAAFNYLKTGIVKIDNLYELENYCLKWGITGKKFYEKKWDYENKLNKNEYEKKDNNDTSNEDINFNEEQDLIIKPLIELKQKLVNNKNATDISKNLYDFMCKALNIDNTNEISFINEENQDVWNLIVEVLAQVSNVFKNRKISFDEYSKILQVALENKELGQIPSSNDCVIVGDINRTKTQRVRAMFIIGVNDRFIPK